MGNPSKYITKNYKKLKASYDYMDATLAGKDLAYFLTKELNKAMAVCKCKDSPEARGIWQFIERYYKRLDFLRKEAEE